MSLLCIIIISLIKEIPQLSLILFYNYKCLCIRLGLDLYCILVRCPVLHCGLDKKIIFLTKKNVEVCWVSLCNEIAGPREI